MATIAQLVINVGMDVADLVGASDKAQKSFAGMVKGMERDARAMRRDLNDLGDDFVKLGGVAIAGAATGLVAITVHSMEAIDKLAKLSDTLGVSTNQLVAMQHAADLAGVDTETFNGSVTTMTKNVADASFGLGKAQKAFKEIGLSAGELVAMAPDKQFEIIADRIAKIENPAIRAQVAIKVFGDAGVKLIPMLKDGSEGLRSAAAEAEALGISLSRIDAAKVEQANDAVTNAKSAFTGLGNTIAVAVSPIIEGLATQFVNAATRADGFKSVVQTALNDLITGVGWAVNSMRGMHLVLLVVEEAFQNLYAVGMLVVSGLTQGFGWLVELVGKLVGVVIGSVSRLVEVLGSVAGVIPGLGGLATVLKNVGDMGMTAADGIWNMSNNLTSTVELMAVNSISAWEKTQKARKALVAEMETPVDYHKDVAAFVKASTEKAALAGGFATQQQSADAARKAREAADLDDWVKKYAGTMESMGKEAVKFSEDSVAAGLNGQAKIQADYDKTIVHFQEKQDEYLKFLRADSSPAEIAIVQDALAKMETARVAAGETRKAQSKLLEGQIAAEMRDKNYEALAAMVKNTEDMSSLAVEKRGFAADEMERRDTEWGTNFRNEFLKNSGASTTMWDEMGKSGGEFGTATNTMFKSTFEDLFLGHLKTAQDYVGAFKDMILKSFGDVVAGWVAKKVTMLILDDLAALWKSAADTAEAFAAGLVNGQAYVAGEQAGRAGGAGAPPAATGLAAGAVLGAGALAGALAGATALSTAASNAAGGIGTPLGQVASFFANPIGNAVQNIGNALGIHFEKGGIMTSLGALPLNPYAGGGIANSPQVAVFGEGRMNEAYVPLPDGRTIPVTMNSGQSQDDNRVVALLTKLVEILSAPQGDTIIQVDGQSLFTLLTNAGTQGRFKLPSSVILNPALI